VTGFSAPTGRSARETADGKLDGKYLLRTSDPELTSEDIALGYKQLLERQPRLRREVVAG
jgi:hypothetical protein